MGISEYEFAKVWESEFDRLHAIASQYVSSASADDVLQDVALEAVLRMRNKDFGSTQDCVRWLYAIVKYRAFDEIRSKMRQIAAVLSCDDAVVRDEPSQESKELENSLFRAIERLPKRQKVVLDLLLRGRKISSIAKSMKISESAVRSHKSEAIRAIKRLFRSEVK